MSAKPQYFRLGVFILGGTALLVAAILVFGGGQFLRPQITMETYVDGTVQGIDVGSPVKFRGVLIGKVTRISFAFTEYEVAEGNDLSNYVVLIMQIDRAVFPDMFKTNLTPLLERGIAQGLRIRIEPQGVTGLNYLDIDYLDPKRFPVLKPTWSPYYYYIPSAPGQLTSFLDSINAILREVEKLNIAGLSKSGTDLLENLNKAVSGSQIEKVSADLQALVAHFDTTLTAANLPALSSDMKNSLVRIDTTLSETKLPAVSADFRKFLGNLEASNRDLRQILKNVEPSSRLNDSQLRDIVRNLAVATANLEQLSTEVKKRPSLLLWGSPPAPKPTPRPPVTPRPRR